MQNKEKFKRNKNQKSLFRCNMKPNEWENVKRKKKTTTNCLLFSLLLSVNIQWKMHLVKFEKVHNKLSCNLLRGFIWIYSHTSNNGNWWKKAATYLFFLFYWKKRRRLNETHSSHETHVRLNERIGEERREREKKIFAIWNYNSHWSLNQCLSVWIVVSLSRCCCYSIHRLRSFLYLI